MTIPPSILEQIEAAATGYVLDQTQKNHDCPACGEQTFWGIDRDTFQAGGRFAFDLGFAHAVECLRTSTFGLKLPSREPVRMTSEEASEWLEAQREGKT